jgi:cold shock CspA family protein
VPLDGTVRIVDHQAGFGFVETAQGEIYLHCNSVVERRFDAIQPGSEGGHGSPHRQASP